MKKIILLCLLFLVSIPSFATNSEIKKKADVCKKIKEDGKFYQLTISDRTDCEFYISQDILESYSNKKKAVEKKKQKYQLTAPDGRIVVVEGTKPPTEEDKKAIFAELPPLEQKGASPESDGFSKIEICKEIQRRGIIDKLEENGKYLCLSILDMEKKAKLSKEDIVKELQEMGYDVGQVSLWDSEWHKLERCEKLKESGVLDNFSDEHKERCLTLIKKEKSRKIKSRLAEVFVFVLFILFLWFIIYKAIPKLIYVLRKAWLKAEQDSKK